ncbi:hypothetical protein AN219_16755 [Streptomyces nanshensis]|nr:hypothetical protein AN219_16755 [Streptomyces nanshensis]
MTAPTPRTLPSPPWPATTEQMPALPTKHEMFLEVITAQMEGSAHLNSALADRELEGHGDRTRGFVE